MDGNDWEEVLAYDTAGAACESAKDMDDTERAFQEEFKRRDKRFGRAIADRKAGLITEEEYNEAFFAVYRLMLAYGRKLRKEKELKWGSQAARIWASAEAALSDYGGCGTSGGDVAAFWTERVVAASGASSLTSTELYEDYCAWCEENSKEPFAHPRVTREFGELGVKKERIGKRTRYFGIALKSVEQRTMR
jgi:hypothetical protein